MSKKTYFVKVTDNFIEEADALKSLLVDIIFDIELFEVWYGSKHYANILILLRI